jgi:putative membrane protein
MSTTTDTESARLKRDWRIKLFLLITSVCFAIASCIKAPAYAYEDGCIVLQHLGTVVLLIPLALELKHQRMSVAACVGLFLFTCVHIVGARYLYSNVPYDKWAKTFLNLDIDLEGQWEIKAVGTGVIHGNKFDRMVHFSFGLLLFPFIYQLTKRLLTDLKPVYALLFAWLAIQSASMIYELFEWFLSLVLSPENAENYNGQQGDMWDAQKDMALALGGSTISALWIFFAGKMWRQSRTDDSAGKENGGTDGTSVQSD